MARCVPTGGPASLLALIPGLDEQPLVGAALGGRVAVNHRLAFPLVGNNVAGADEPIIVRQGWTLDEVRDQVFGGRGESVGVTAATQADRLALVDELTEPIEPAHPGLPNGEA